MRHRIKKILTLSKLNHKFNHHLLHSDKSTYIYFYKDKVKGLLYSPSIPLLGGAALLLVLGLMISPSMAAGGSGGMLGRVDKASAVSEQDFGAGRTVSLSIINNGTALADDATVSTNVETPGTVSYIDNTIRINTSKIAKYYVGVQAASDGSSVLTGANHGDTIVGVGSNVNPSNFGDNTWGYNLTDNTTMPDNQLTYSTLPANNTVSPLQYTSPANPEDGNHDLKLTFAAKINANKPADHYQTKAMVSVAADPKALFSGITTMQQMTPTICNGAVENETTQLVDSRDNKPYWVAKLKDGNCWMTQNLDLDITASGLKAVDTDITTDWNSNSTYKPAVTQSSTANPSDFSSGGNLVASYDPGEKYCINSNCASTSATSNSDGHNAQGNYYTFTAVTAGTGGGKTSGNADGSICPKNWQLPISNSLTTNKSFGKLLNGLTGEVVSKNPYYFVAGGFIHEGTLQSTGGAFYWSSTMRENSVTAGFYLYFNLTSTVVNPSNDTGRRFNGLTVRCVAK